MNQDNIFAILNRHVFAEEKAYLIRNITTNPERFVGMFRSTTPRLKLIQNLLQSREIRFGDALEVVIRDIIEGLGYVNLPRKVQLSENEFLNMDQYFTVPDESRFYLVEQKVRDDHDSSKKKGQIGNFESKLNYLHTLHGSSLVGIMYFIDPALTKNANYYSKKLKELSDRVGVPVQLFYNGDFFEYLSGSTESWELLRNSLLSWRNTVPDDVSLNCDLANDLDELKTLAPSLWFKLISNDLLWENGVIRCVFPEGTNLKDMSLWFAQQGSRIFWVGRTRITCRQLADLMHQKVTRHYVIDYDLPNEPQSPL